MSSVTTFAILLSLFGSLFFCLLWQDIKEGYSEVKMSVQRRWKTAWAHKAELNLEDKWRSGARIAIWDDPGCNSAHSGSGVTRGPVRDCIYSPARSPCQPFCKWPSIPQGGRIGLAPFALFIHPPHMLIYPIRTGHALSADVSKHGGGPGWGVAGHSGR